MKLVQHDGVILVEPDEPAEMQADEPELIEIDLEDEEAHGDVPRIVLAESFADMEQIMRRWDEHGLIPRLKRSLGI